jgi:AcrR family transcriptional regulator
VANGLAAAQQGALVFDFPGRGSAEQIRREVASILREHVGAHRALPRERIAAHVKARLGLHHMTRETVLRRVREAVEECLADGMRVVGGRTGLYLAETSDEIMEGDKALLLNMLGAARRLASFRRVTLSALLGHLGQAELALSEADRLEPPPVANTLPPRGAQEGGA